jgi:hypothetical protein
MLAAAIAVVGVAPGGAIGSAVSPNVDWQTDLPVQPTQPAGGLAAVSCWAPTGCVAVGSMLADPNPGPDEIVSPMAERFDGSKWSLMTLPVTPGVSLAAVSCPSADLCMAVGSTRSASSEGPISELWNGSAWKPVPTPDADPTAPDYSVGGQLTSVSCPAVDWCIAVGNDSEGADVAAPLLEAWTGIDWRVISTPLREGDELDSVACSSDTWCVAVGSVIASDGFNQVALAYRWNGSGWSGMSIDPKPDPSQTLESVSCTSPTACTAVGWGGAETAGGHPLVRRWNGSTWATQASGLPASAVLVAVACGGTKACAAVGNNPPVNGRSDAAGWDGTAWSVQATPAPYPHWSTVVDAVACPSATACFAVGESADDNEGEATDPSQGQARALVESDVGGGWALQPAATPVRPVVSSLDGVSCSSASTCTAVGSQSDFGLAEQRTDAGWSAQSLGPSSAATSGGLSDVVCVTTAWCMAVGPAPDRDGSLLESSQFSGSATAVTWNGATWTPLAVPAPNGATESELFGVTCPTVTRCVAVGDYLEADGDRLPLLETWDGTTWRASSPSVGGSTDASLSAISCPSADDCTAVGNVLVDQTDSPPYGRSEALVEHWNGTTWTAQDVPGPAGIDAPVLSGVWCSASSCVAVGNSETALSSALVATGAGTTWKLANLPLPPGTSSAVLTAVSCLSTVQCWAVGGTSPDADGDGEPLIESLSGANWTATASAPASDDGELWAVSCGASAACTAVGSTTDGRPLAESFGPDVVPSAPSIAQAVGSDSGVSLSWHAPADDHGSALTGYVVTPHQGSTDLAPTTFGPGTTSVAVGGLTNGVAYTFTVAAVNGAGTGPASPPSAVTVPPFAQAGGFVNQQDRDFAGRAASSDEISSVVADIGAGIAPSDLVADQRATPDAVHHVDPVVRLYMAYFRRLPDLGGYSFWTGRSRSGVSLDAVSANFAASHEFAATYGSLTNAQFVSLVYQNVLGRAGDAAGLSYWTGQLDSQARTRGQVMVGFSESSEFRTETDATVDVAVTWIDMLGAEPPAASLSAWASELTSHAATESDLTAAILAMPAYATRVSGG